MLSFGLSGERAMLQPELSYTGAYTGRFVSGMVGRAVHSARFAKNMDGGLSREVGITRNWRLVVGGAT